MDKEVLVDNETLVEGLKALIREYAQNGQVFTLVMLIPTDPWAINTSYTLLISAPWLDNQDPKQAINLILRGLINQFGTDSAEYGKIDRITVVNTTDPFVAAITSAFKIGKEGSLTIRNCVINGIPIEQAILLQSNRPTTHASSRIK